LENSDEVLIQRTLDGEINSFDEIMQRYERLVFKIVYSFGGNRENALDITQTVFLKAFDNLRAYRKDSSFKTWLLRIAYNEGISWIRSPKNNADLHVNVEDEVLFSWSSQELCLLEKEQGQLIQRGLCSLNGRYRTAILLRYVHDMPIREIAGVLQCSENMTKNILFRGIRNLRNFFCIAQGSTGHERMPQI
jgi:RNA polymerase sigma-70 factor, ECF subfamily